MHYAWGQAQFTNDQFIEIKYPQEIFVLEINIYETYHCGAIVKIKLKDLSTDEWKIVWETETASHIENSRIFSPTLTKSFFKTNQVRLELDCTLANSYCEIDAVEVVGKKLLIDLDSIEDNYSKNLEKLLFSDIFNAVEFKIDNQIVKAHRNILTTRSQYFKNLLCDNLTPDRLRKSIYVDNITYDGFVCLMHYLYTGKIDENTKCQTVCELIRVSDWYNLEQLDTIGFLFLKSVLSLENVLSILICAAKIKPNLERVEKMCLKYTAKNFNQVLIQPEFKSLEKDILLKITQYYSQFLKK